MWVVRNDAREMMTLMKYDVFYACRIVDTAVKNVQCRLNI